MKILMTVFQMLDYGGIVQYTENLARGFIEDGHTVRVILLRDSERDPYIRQADTVVEGNYKSTIANRAHAANGWYGIKVYSYGNKRQRNIWRRYAEKFDLVIHQIPVPEADKKGAWRKLYDIETSQILVSHDAHFPDRYPHLIDIADKIVGIAAVNPASLASLAEFPAPRCLIGSPHIPRKKEWKRNKWSARPIRFASAHVWKPWKHMDLVVRAIPYTKKLGVKNWIGGDGIEARYMRSKDKCKPKYEGIWERALKAGMIYEGMTSPKILLREYSDSRVMVDMSYSKKFEQYGNHVNRSTLEAYNAGCVPLVTHENMVERKPRIFKNFHTHLEVKADITPKQLAEAIRDACTISPASAEVIIHNGRELLMRHWDYRVVAQHFIELMKHKKKAGIHRELLHGKLTPEIKARRDKYMDRIHGR